MIMTFSFPEKKISVNGVEYTLNSNGVANVTLGPHDAPGDYPLVVKVNGTTVLDQTYPVAQTTYTATSSGSFTQYEQGTLTITAKRNGVAYSGAATLAGKAITFTNGKATYTTTYNTSGKQSLKLVIDGQTITLSVTVAAATYSVEAEDYTVQEYESEAVSFTVKRNGKPYQGAVTLAHNSNITSSTKSTTSNASGLVSITVTGATAGAKRDLDARFHILAGHVGDVQAAAGDASRWTQWGAGMWAGLTFLEDCRNTCPAYFRGLHWHNLLKTLTTLCNAKNPLSVRAGRGIFLCLQSDFFATNRISSRCSGSHLHLFRHHHGVMMNRPSAFAFLSGCAPDTAQSREHSIRAWYRSPCGQRKFSSSSGIGNGIASLLFLKRRVRYGVE